MDKKIIFFIFLLIIPISLADIVETFPTLATFTSNQMTTTQLNWVNRSSNLKYYGDACVYSLGSASYVNDNATIDIANYYNAYDDSGYQLHIDERALRYVMLCNNPIQIGDNAKFSFMVNVSTSGESNFYFGMVFINSTGGYYFDMNAAWNGGNTFYDGGNYYSNGYTAGLPYINTTFPSSTTIDISSVQVQNQSYDAWGLIISNALSSDVHFTIAGFNLTDVEQANNTLPEFNVTFNESYNCIEYDQEFPYVVDVDFQVDDLEGNKVYYAESYHLTNFTDFLYFEDYLCSDFNPVAFLYFPYISYENWLSTKERICLRVKGTEDIYDNFVHNSTFSGLCPIDTWKYTELFHSITEYENGVGLESWQLLLNGNCRDEDHSVIYDTGYNSYSANIEFEVNDLDIGDVLNLTLLDAFLDDNYLHLNFYRNNSQFYIEAGNGSILHNFSSSSSSYRIQISNTYDNQDVHYIEVRYVTGLVIDTIFEGTFQYDDSSKDKFKYVKLGIDSGGEILIDYILGTYVGETLSWSEQQPNNITFYKPDYKHVFYYVTDSWHYPDEYNEQNYWIRLEQKERCYDLDYEDVDEYIDVLGNPLRGFLDYLDIDEEMQTALYILFFILFVFFNVSYYKMTKGNISLTISGLLSSLICFIFSYVLAYSSQMVVFLIIFALSSVALVLTRNE